MPRAMNPARTRSSTSFLMASRCSVGAPLKNCAGPFSKFAGTSQRKYVNAGANSRSIINSIASAVARSTSSPTIHPVVFGDRGIRRVAESLCYTIHLGDWNPNAANRGATGQARGYSRGCVMASWFLWLFGDPQLARRYAEVHYDHFFVPARQTEDARFPGRVIKTHNIYEAEGSGFPNTRVGLRNHRYFRPWEDCLGTYGYAGLYRLLLDTYPTQAAGFLELARTTASDVLRYGSPRIIDETTGRQVFAVSPSFDFIALATAFLNGTRQLTAAEMADNNWERCRDISGNEQCAVSGEGYMKLESGSGTFAWYLTWWVLSDAIGSQDLMLHRYIRNAATTPKLWDPVDNRPGNYNHLEWLKDTQRYGGIGYVDRLTLGATTTRGAAATNASDMTVSRTTSDAAWLTGAATGNWRRVSRATGALQTSVAPPVGLTSPAIGWMVKVSSSRSN